MIKNLDIGRLSWIICVCPKCNLKGLHKKEAKDQRTQKEIKDVALLFLKVQKGAMSPKNVGRLWKTERARKPI